MRENLVGKVYGSLEVVRELGKDHNYHYLWECKCDCGGMRVSSTSHLKNGRVFHCKSCEAAISKKVTHNMTGTKLYSVWNSMLQRCNNPNDTSYKNYGGRGISVCSRWRSSVNFFTDMKEGYRDGLTLDRRDNGGNYNKSNCRWVSKKVQANNSRHNTHITYSGETLTIAQWANRLGRDSGFITGRLANGWTEEDAVSTPIIIKGKRAILSFNGLSMDDKEWSKKLGGREDMVRTRLRRGWPKIRALTTECLMIR